jgi:hypothetical protein
MARPAIRTALVATLAAGIGCAAVAVAAPAAGHGRHGALKTTLLPTQPAPTDSQCQAATTGTPQGFAVLNAPGKPGGAPSRVVGTLSLKKAAQHNTEFSVQLGTAGTCTDTGAKLTTNSVGNGTAHFDLKLPSGASATAYYVVLQAPAAAAALAVLPASVAPAEYYASKVVTLS